MKWLMAVCCFLGAAVLRAQTPVVDCVVQNSQTGMYTAYFGYTGNGSGVTIPPGPANSVDATAILRGTLPTSFIGSAQHMLFSLTFASGVTPAWHLNGPTRSPPRGPCPDARLPLAAASPPTPNYAAGIATRISLATPPKTWMATASAASSIAPAHPARRARRGCRARTA